MKKVFTNTYNSWSYIYIAMGTSFWWSQTRSYHFTANAIKCNENSSSVVFNLCVSASKQMSLYTITDSEKHLVALWKRLSGRKFGKQYGTFFLEYVLLDRTFSWIAQMIFPLKFGSHRVGVIPKWNYGWQIILTVER